MGDADARYGYARVSSKAQDYAAQVEALEAAGCEKIFSEKMSGKSTNGRREFDKLMRALLPGDIVVVTGSIGWLGPAAICSTSCMTSMRRAAALSRSANSGATPQPRSAV